MSNQRRNLKPEFGRKNVGSLFADKKVLNPFAGIQRQPDWTN
jgi:hypothetical protein